MFENDNFEIFDDVSKMNPLHFEQREQMLSSMMMMKLKREELIERSLSMLTEDKN